MEPNDDQNLPARRPADPAAPSRNLTTAELEAVIRRAVELQTGDPARSDEGISETDVVRIGQELGIEPATIRHAMAEVRGRPAEERGALVGLVGAGTIRASRVLRRSAAAVRPVLDQHLRQGELMVPQRRFPDRTRYVRDSSFGAGMARIGRGLSQSRKPLGLKQLDVAVSALDPGSCLVEVSTDLGGLRGGLLAGVLGSSGGAVAGWAAMVWATPIADPLMLLGVPALGAAWLGTRAIYSTISRSTEDKLEALLDRLEHNDLS